MTQLTSNYFVWSHPSPKKKKFKGLNFSDVPLLMGIINLTPDSFSDGGKYNKKKRNDVFKEYTKNEF